MIAGVCGGLAEYFHINAPLVRAGFLLLVLMQGLGFLVYLLLLLVLPPPDPDVRAEGTVGSRATASPATRRSPVLVVLGFAGMIGGAVVSLVSFLADMGGALDLLHLRTWVESLLPHSASGRATSQEDEFPPSETGPTVLPGATILEWILGEERYHATLNLQGESGTALVVWKAGTIVQDLSFRQYSNGSAAFVGSHVRALVGNASYYAPDVFVVRKAARGFQFTMACDESWTTCARLRVLDVPGLSELRPSAAR